MECKITSAESQFCVRGSDERLDCSCLSEVRVPSTLPDLPSFDCPSTTVPPTFKTTPVSVSGGTTDHTTSTMSSDEQTLLTMRNETQACCGPGVYGLIVIIIIVFIFFLIVILVRYKRKSKLHAKYHTSKVEEANGTKIQNPAEAVPLKSHNWVGSTPNSSKPNIPQSQSAEPLGLSELALVVRTPSDPQLMVDEESRVQDLQTQPSQVELIAKDDDAV